MKKVTVRENATTNTTKEDLLLETPAPKKVPTVASKTTVTSALKAAPKVPTTAATKIANKSTDNEASATPARWNANPLTDATASRINSRQGALNAVALNTPYAKAKMQKIIDELLEKEVARRARLEHDEENEYVLMRTQQRSEIRVVTALSDVVKEETNARWALEDFETRSYLTIHRALVIENDSSRTKQTCMVEEDTDRINLTHEERNQRRLAACKEQERVERSNVKEDETFQFNALLSNEEFFRDHFAAIKKRVNQVMEEASANREEIVLRESTTRLKIEEEFLYATNVIVAFQDKRVELQRLEKLQREMVFDAFTTSRNVLQCQYKDEGAERESQLQRFAWERQSAVQEEWKSRDIILTQESSSRIALLSEMKRLTIVCEEWVQQKATEKCNLLDEALEGQGVIADLETKERIAIIANAREEYEATHELIRMKIAQRHKLEMEADAERSTLQQSEERERSNMKNQRRLLGERLTAMLDSNTQERRVFLYSEEPARQQIVTLEREAREILRSDCVQIGEMIVKHLAVQAEEQKKFCESAISSRVVIERQFTEGLENLISEMKFIGVEINEILLKWDKAREEFALHESEIREVVIADYTAAIEEIMELKREEFFRVFIVQNLRVLEMEESECRKGVRAEWLEEWLHLEAELIDTKPVEYEKEEEEDVDVCNPNQVVCDVPEVSTPEQRRDEAQYSEDMYDEDVRATFDIVVPRMSVTPMASRRSYFRQSIVPQYNNTNVNTCITNYHKEYIEHETQIAKATLCDDLAEIVCQRLITLNTEDEECEMEEQRTIAEIEQLTKRLNAAKKDADLARCDLSYAKDASTRREKERAVSLKNSKDRRKQEDLKVKESTKRLTEATALNKKSKDLLEEWKDKVRDAMRAPKKTTK